MDRTKYLDYFFVLRPTLFFPVWTVFLAGYHASLHFDPGKIAQNSPLVVAILLSLLMGAVFIFNQLTDIETDRKNQKLFFIANGMIKKTVAIAQGITLTIFSIGISFLMNNKVGLVFSLIFGFTGILYSFRPFSWKDKPILGVINNFLGGWSVAVCGWITAGAYNWKFAIYAIPYALGLVAVYLLTTLPDIPGDGESGKITFGVKYGVKISIYWASGFELTAVILSFLFKDYILFVPAVMAFPLFLNAAITQKMNNILSAIKFTVLFSSLAVCFKYPLYFVVILATFYFSKWYYRRRFNLEYPRFAA